ncbi:MAG: hypothetical protein ACC700_17070 [Anaerolineales bacterium]
MTMVDFNSQGRNHMGVLVREWIIEILQDRQELLGLAVRQRSKFEGWLKLELAATAAKHGAIKIEIEAPYPSPQIGPRADLAFSYGGNRYFIELKTPNTNWRMPGVIGSTRPITKNIDGVISDAEKIASRGICGIVAFVMFPVRPASRNWIAYFKRIVTKLGIPEATAGDNSAQIAIRLPDGNFADVVVATLEFLSTDCEEQS